MIASYKALGPHGRDEAEHLLGSNSDFLMAQPHTLLCHISQLFFPREKKSARKIECRRTET